MYIEDAIALGASVGLVALVITLAVMFRRRHKQLLAEENAKMEQRKKDVEEYWSEKRKSYVNKPIPPKKTETSVPPRGKEMTKKYKSYDTMERTTVTRKDDNDDLLTGMLIGAAIDSVVHSSIGSGRSIFSSSDDSSSSSSSWGLDDSDSRSSISSSMSDVFSSDDGPSSDW